MSVVYAPDLLRYVCHLLQRASVMFDLPVQDASTLPLSPPSNVSFQSDNSSELAQELIKHAENILVKIAQSNKQTQDIRDDYLKLDARCEELHEEIARLEAEVAVQNRDSAGGDERKLREAARTTGDLLYISDVSMREPSLDCASVECSKRSEVPEKKLDRRFLCPSAARQSLSPNTGQEVDIRSLYCTRELEGERGEQWLEGVQADRVCIQLSCEPDAASFRSTGSYLHFESTEHASDNLQTHLTPASGWPPPGCPASGWPPPGCPASGWPPPEGVLGEEGDVMARLTFTPTYKETKREDSCSVIQLTNSTPESVASEYSERCRAPVASETFACIKKHATPFLGVTHQRRSVSYYTALSRPTKRQSPPPRESPARKHPSPRAKGSQARVIYLSENKLPGLGRQTAAFATKPPEGALDELCFNMATAANSFVTNDDQSKYSQLNISLPQNSKEPKTASRFLRRIMRGIRGS